MKLVDLRKVGAFVETELVEKPVEWEGNHFTVLVRKLSFGDFEAIFRVKEGESQSAAILSKTVFLMDEKRLMTYEEAYQLQASLAAKLMDAVKEASGLNDPKPSPPQTSSSVSSDSPSAKPSAS